MFSAGPGGQGSLIQGLRSAREARVHMHFDRHARAQACTGTDDVVAEAEVVVHHLSSIPPSHVRVTSESLPSHLPAAAEAVAHRLSHHVRVMSESYPPGRFGPKGEGREPKVCVCGKRVVRMGRGGRGGGVRGA